MTSIEPGWYRDPAEPTTQRYWDGEGWIGEAIPADATPPAAPDVPVPVAQPPSAPDAVAPSPGQPTAAQPATPAAGPAIPPTNQHPGVQPVPGQPVPGQPVPGQQAPGQQVPGQQAAGQPPVGQQPGRWPPPGPWPPASRPANLPPGVPYPMPRPQPPAPQPHGFPLASISARLLARLVDIAVVGLLNVVVNGWFVVQYVQEVEPYVREVRERFMNGEQAGDAALTGRAAWLQLTILGLAIALWFAYEVPATANEGQTLGKRLLRIKVVGVESTQPLGVRRAWRRWNPLGLPALLWTCYGVGFLFQAADLLVGIIDRPLHQALHDKSAGTVVVRVGKPGRPDEPAGRSATVEPHSDDHQNAQPAPRDGDPT